MSQPDFEQMWRDLLPVGRSAGSGGYVRTPWGAAEREAFAWWRGQAESRGLDVQTDPVGNAVAWWGGRPQPGGPRAVLTGSHLDSVLDGGAFDGPLGVASALAAVDLLRARGVTPSRPVGLAVFVEEEGSRFGQACLGSRLATGALPWHRAAGLRDRDGTRLDEALASAGLAPDPDHVVWTELTDRVGCFVELHVEQGRDLVDRDAAVGVASAIWPHGRYRFDFTGEANHAGTTRMQDRHDPMLTYAMTALAANKQARLGGQRATFGRVEVHPNGTNAVPSRVTAWLDARAESEDRLDELLGQVGRLARDRAGRDGTAVHVVAESVSAQVRFDAGLAHRLATLPAADGADPWPVVSTMAGHDAGVMQAAGVPTAMLFVRNPTGVSHSPAEHAAMADCLAGVEALAAVLTDLTADPSLPEGFSRRVARESTARQEPRA